MERRFESGATRDSTEGKFDYEGFLSPVVLKRYAEYMEANRHRPDGGLRESDNWQRGMPTEVYIKSAVRHLVTWWGIHREVHNGGILTLKGERQLEEALCGMMFNVMGYLFETLRHAPLEFPTSVEIFDEGVSPIKGPTCK